MDQDLRIAIATKKDAELIAEISRKTFSDTFAPHNTPENMELFLNTQFTHKQLVAQLGAPGNTFLIAFLGDEPVGYARLFEGTEVPPEIADTPNIEISRLYAVQHAIGKGIGRALMEACIDFGRSNKKDWIWLGVWEHNHRAIAFYEKMGFGIFERHIFLLGRDVQYDWVMKRRL
jgi:ribosomal protein S18 acetylase RimI-like enzyme